MTNPTPTPFTLPGIDLMVAPEDGPIKGWPAGYTNYDSTTSAQKRSGRAPTQAEIDAPDQQHWLRQVGERQCPVRLHGLALANVGGVEAPLPPPQVCWG